MDIDDQFSEFTFKDTFGCQGLYLGARIYGIGDQFPEEDLVVRI